MQSKSRQSPFSTRTISLPRETVNANKRLCLDLSLPLLIAGHWNKCGERSDIHENCPLRSGSGRAAACVSSQFDTSTSRTNERVRACALLYTCLAGGR